MKVKHNYVNTKEFYTEMVNWKASGDEKVPDEIARKIMMICTELSKSWQFAGYTENWKSDMIGDAIYNCIRYANYFDTERFTNPFSYFTSIAYNAFLRRLNIEKKQLEITEKYKKFACSSLYDSLTDEEKEAFDFVNENAKNFDMHINMGKENAQEKKKKKKKINTLEAFLDA